MSCYSKRAVCILCASKPYNLVAEMQFKIVKSRIDKLPRGGIIYDSEIKGFVARALPSGKVSYGFRYRNLAGQSKWLALGIHGSITADEARTLAKKRAGEVADARDPASERKGARANSAKAKVANESTVNAVLDVFVKRHASQLRSSGQVERAFDKYVRPCLGHKSIYDLKRRDIVGMLDTIEDKGGPVMADRTLAHIRKAFNWQAARDDDFVSPIVRGMARTRPKERARKRVLADEEIRDIWHALEVADVPACYPSYVKSLVLTATRRNEAANIRSIEVEGDVWTIPGSRYKNKHDHVIPLTKCVKDLIGLKPEGFSGNAYFIFSTTEGRRPFSGFAKAKKILDTEIARARKAEGRGDMPRWTLHDLRRTARSLMSRAQVPADHAERAIGHVMGGVRETYDRHEFLEEKRHVFNKLSELLDLILQEQSTRSLDSNLCPS